MLEINYICPRTSVWNELVTQGINLLITHGVIMTYLKFTLAFFWFQSSIIRAVLIQLIAVGFGCGAVFIKQTCPCAEASIPQKPCLPYPGELK